MPPAKEKEEREKERDKAIQGKKGEGERRKTLFQSGDRREERERRCEREGKRRHVSNHESLLFFPPLLFLGNKDRERDRERTEGV